MKYDNINPLKISSPQLKTIFCGGLSCRALTNFMTKLKLVKIEKINRNKYIVL